MVIKSNQNVVENPVNIATLIATLKHSLLIRSFYF